VDRGQVLAESLAALTAWYAELEAGRGAAVIEQWRRRAVATFGRPVEWSVDGVAQTGVAENIDENGALLVKTNAGVMRVISGEVRWL
jgi:BirA family biotin operon repressor/biotin-[acetyl-CoA-carboxylase] ligase